MTGAQELAECARCMGCGYGFGTVNKLGDQRLRHFQSFKELSVGPHAVTLASRRWRQEDHKFKVIQPRLHKILKN